MTRDNRGWGDLTRAEFFAKVCLEERRFGGLLNLFKSFVPHNKLPLAVQFLEHLLAHGYRSRYCGELFDFLAFRVGEKPVIGVLSVRNRFSQALVRKLANRSVSYAVVFLEHGAKDLRYIDGPGLLLAALGVGVFVDGLGWRVLPGSAFPENRLNYAYSQSSRWELGKDGVWRKWCRNCQQLLPEDEFYDRPRASGKEPKRAICKNCFKSKQKARKSPSQIDSFGILAGGLGGHS